MSVASQLLHQETDCVINSPLLSSLMSDYAEQDYFEILDLMPASGQFIDLFSAHHCKLYLPGCHAALSALNLDALDSENKLNSAFINSLGFKQQNKAALNLILLWDLPNYLEARLLQALVQYLLPHCAAKVMLHTYIHTREQMPVTPANYKLQNDRRVAVEQTNTQTCLSPMYYQESLQKAMSPFLVQRGILLSGGMKEYIMRLG